VETTTSYEVLTYKDEHWVIVGMNDSREEAIREAKALESSRHLKAVAVLQDTTELKSGKTSSMVIFKGGKEAATLDPLMKEAKKREYKRPKKQPEKQPEKPDSAAVQAPEATNVNEPERKKAKGSLREFVFRMEMLVLAVGAVGLGLIIGVLAYIGGAN